MRSTRARVPASRGLGARSLHLPRAGLGWALALGLVVLLAGLGPRMAFPAAPVDPGFQGLFQVYQANRRDGIPNLVTADLLLTSYSLTRQRQLLVQEQAMAERLSILVEGLARAVAVEPDDGPGAANRDLIAVLDALLRGEEQTSAVAADAQRPPAQAGGSARARAELDRVLRAEGIATSPLWGWPLDYSQLRPRGPYAADPGLAAYFRAMRYAGLVLFPVLESQATGVSAEAADRATVQALRLARQIQADPALRAEYDAIDAAYRWQFGRSEDLTIDDLLAAPADATPAETRAWLLGRARAEGRQPRILAGLVDATALEPGRTSADVLTGFRLLPSRYGADTAALQRLVYDQVGAYLGDASATPAPFGLGRINGEAVKAYPSVNELLALLGSDRARTALEADGETDFRGYPWAAADAAERLLQAEGLLALQLRLMRAALDPTPRQGGAVVSPETAALLDTRMKAFWTWQRYLGVLHGKPSYSAGGKGYVTPQPRTAAWLEPALPLYQALADLVGAHAEQAPNAASRAQWDALSEVLLRVIAIAEQELRGEALDADDIDWLNALDLHLGNIGGNRDRPIVVDIHSSPATGQIVVEGTAAPEVVTHALPDGGHARGARLTHHERKWPLARRPTNADWREWLQQRAVEPASSREGAPGPRSSQSEVVE